MLEGKTVVIGVCGGIAAYKAVEVVSGLRKLGAKTYVIMTENATKLVAPITFRTISNQPVVTEMFQEPRIWNVEHIALADAADLFLVCPATANVIGKIASGIADDFLTTTIMACTAPKLICPAMNHHMYSNPIVQENIGKLRNLGYHIMEPEYGRLASGAYGKGRLPDPEKIVQEVVRILQLKDSESKEFSGETSDLSGISLLVTAGPTREWIDPVRFVSNPSSGKMGYAIAQVASEMGAKVYLVSGPTQIQPPPGVEVTRVETADEMLQACLKLFDRVQVVIGAAAPSDFRVEEKSLHKIKKTDDNGGEKPLVLKFIPTPDVIKTLGEKNARENLGKIMVGFAAETENLLEYAMSKIKAKHLDFICANRVGDPGVAFSSDRNAVTMVFPDGSQIETGLLPKREVARSILSQVYRLAEKKGLLKHA